MISSSLVFSVVSWLLLVAHLAAAIAVVRYNFAFKWVPVLNLLIVSAVFVYWAERWFKVFNQGIQFYWSDQIYPLYALVVIIISVLFFVGKNIGNGFHWTIYSVHMLVIVGATLFATFFKMNRLW